MTLNLTGFEPGRLTELARLQQRLQGNGAAEQLRQALTDTAHDHGRRVVFALRFDQAVGCAGWILSEAAGGGSAYGYPVFAEDDEAAACLVARIEAAAREAGAATLRVSCYPGEAAKRRILEGGGYRPVFQFVRFGIGLPLDGPIELPAPLRAVPIEAVDWHRLAGLQAEVFRAVPNTPPVSAEQMREQWRLSNQQAGRVLADASGVYQAFSLIEDTEVGAVGVTQAWRGTGLAAILYRLAGRALARHGHTQMTALVASLNAASMRFHQKLGFAEVRPRFEVLERDLMTQSPSSTPFSAQSG